MPGLVPGISLSNAGPFLNRIAADYDVNPDGS